MQLSLDVTGAVADIFTASPILISLEAKDTISQVRKIGFLSHREGTKLLFVYPYYYISWLESVY